MQVINESRFPIKAWIDGVPIEDVARQQLLNIANLPFIFKHVAVMPDVHWGMGATIGSVIATKGAVIPAAVGVDLGCGMIAQKLSIKADALPDNLGPIRSAIEKAVPHGRSDHGGREDRGAWSDVTPPFSSMYYEKFRNRIINVLQKNPHIGKQGHDDLLLRGERQLGTLGGGNHFIELCVDKNNDLWIMLHSGSRGLGNIFASYFIQKAKEQAALYFYEEHLPDKDLGWLSDSTPIFEEYCEAIAVAQDYAYANRELMLIATMNALGSCGLAFSIEADKVVNCHHNYLARESHFGENVLVTRKGAVRAREGDMAIIPGSMGARSFIVRGKGNRDSFMSCSHGAGRAMSRNEAKKRFTIEDHAKATAGVECRQDAGVLDETPGAYKDIDAVIAAQSDLIEVEHTLKALLCVKG